MMKLRQRSGVRGAVMAAAGVMAPFGHCQAQSPDKDAKPVTAATTPGDYKGDCFRLVAKPDAPFGLKDDGTYMVLSQDRREGDPKLNVIEADNLWRGFLSCTPRPGAKVIKDVPASAMIESGAIRTGWTYGVLALPYKYHLDDKSFSSGVSVGPYIGRRIDAWGAGYTVAATMAIGTVTGTSTDTAGNTTSPTLAAFTFAGGVMFDVSKGSKPFKAGLFVGRDVVGRDSGAMYPHNRKTWIAVQLGYDFTDN
jgi:hypothetical protein